MVIFFIWNIQLGPLTSFIAAHDVEREKRRLISLFAGKDGGFKEIKLEKSDFLLLKDHSFNQLPVSLGRDSMEITSVGVPFSVADTRLYTLLSRSIRPSIRQSVTF